MDSVCDKLSQFQMPNTSERLEACPTTKEQGNAQQHYMNEEDDVPVGNEPSWTNWAGQSEKNSCWSTSDHSQDKAADIPSGEGERENERPLAAINAGTAKGRAEHSERIWAQNAVEQKTSIAEPNVAHGTSKDKDHRQSSRSRPRRSQSRLTDVGTGKIQHQYSRSSNVENDGIPWGRELEQNQIACSQSWRQRKQNSPVLDHGRKRWESQQDQADNVEW